MTDETTLGQVNFEQPSDASDLLAQILPPGTEGQVLTMTSGVGTFQDPTGAGGMTFKKAWKIMSYGF